MVHGGAWWDIVTWRCMVTYGGTQSLIPTWKRVVDQPGLHSEFQANQAYIVKPCLKNKRKEVLIITPPQKKVNLTLHLLALHSEHHADNGNGETGINSLGPSTVLSAPC